MKMRYPIVFVFAFFWACKIGQQEDFYQIQMIDLKNINIDQKYDYSNIINVEDIIKLETHEECIIGRITKILYKNERFFIFDRASQAIYVFNKNGSYEKKLSKQGYGPNEYQEIRDFDINERGDIRILTHSSINTYDNLTMNLMHKFDIEIFEDKEIPFPPILFLDNDLYTFIFRGSFGLMGSDYKDIYSIICVDNHKKVIEKYFPVKFIYPFSHQTFYKSTTRVLVTDTFSNDTIYQVLTNKIIPAFYVDFGKYKVTEKHMDETVQDRFSNFVNSGLMGGIQKVYENMNFLSFLFSYKNEIKQVVFNKSSNNYYIFNLSDSMKPLPWINPSGVMENSFISIIEPYMLVGIENEDILMDKSSFTFNDNPFLIIYSYDFH
jgi:hypothetical protein